MKKFFKIVFAIILLLIICGIIFFLVDYNRVKNQKLPIFASDFGGIFTYMDGGTRIYLGLGYKVIAFNKLEAEVTYKGIHICSWFKDSDEVYRDVRGEEFSRLDSSSQEVYTILKEFYSKEEPNNLLKTMREENHNRIEPYIEKMPGGGDVLDINKIENLKVTEGEEAWYKFVLEAYETKEFSEGNKEKLYVYLRTFYVSNRDNISTELKEKLLEMYLEY